VQYSTTVRNAKLDAVETAIGVSPTLKIFTGSKPAACATADSGTVLATLALPSDWMAAASGGSKAKSGTWQDLAADGSGTAGYYRIYDSGGTCHMQGTCGLSAADMILDSIQFTASQQFSVTSFQINDNNG
jgi:hypothetical protein